MTNKSWIKSSFIYVIFDIINKSVPFLLLPILTRFLSIAELGNVSIFLSSVTFFLIFTGMSSNGIVSVNYFQRNRSDFILTVSSSILLLIISSMVIIGIMYCLPNSLFMKFGFTRNWGLLGVMAAAAYFLSLINLTIWQVQQKPFKYSIYQLSQTLLNICFSLYLVISLSMGDVGRIYGYSTAYIIVALISIYLLLDNGFLSFRVNKQIFVECTKFGAYLIPSVLSKWVIINIDRFYMSYFYGQETVGLYFAAIQFGLVITTCSVAFQRAYYPIVFSQLEEGSEKSLIKIVKFAYFYIFAATIFVILCSGIAYQSVVFLLGDNYGEIRNFLHWILIGFGFHAISMIFTNVLLYTKKTYLISSVSIFSSCMHVLISYLMSKNYGISGAAMAFCLTNFITVLLLCAISSKTVKFPWLIGFLELIKKPKEQK